MGRVLGGVALPARPRTHRPDFYLGTHRPNWLGLTAVPLFVSRRTLAPRRRLPRALGPWALDSGGFSELSLHGKWTVTPRQYVAEVRRFRDEVGGLEWAAAMDHMCEEVILKKTGKTVREHQDLTAANYLELASLAPDLPWVPVLQGWHAADYHRHADAYARAGVDLAALPRVGVGSVCRRQATGAAEALFAELAARGLKLHGFGIKLGGLARAARSLASADSLAWSYAARLGEPLPGCAHGKCNNCLRYALLWRGRVERAIDRSLAKPVQLNLFDSPG